MAAATYTSKFPGPFPRDTATGLQSNETGLNVPKGVTLPSSFSNGSDSLSDHLYSGGSNPMNNNYHLLERTELTSASSSASSSSSPSSLSSSSSVFLRVYKVIHYYFLLEKDPNSRLSELNFDTNIIVNLNYLKRYEWSTGDIIHYGFLVLILLFCFLIFPASFLVKFPIIALFGLMFAIPLTSQFFLPALPIFTWLALFFSCAKIPVTWRLPISVRFLPAFETVMYGDNLSSVLAAFTHPVLDILAWLPYGIIHFSVPFVVAALIFIFGPPTSLRAYGFAFGYMNLFGVIMQLLFPAAPPWYKLNNGLAPANYSMGGSPGGLARIDDIVGFDMYTSTFTNAPVPFGAFPSLHSGCAVMECLFLIWLFPKLKFVWCGYVMWLWWCTMYLTHHYFIDLIGGAVLSLCVFTYTSYVHLPIRLPNKFCRWSYTEILFIDYHEINPLTVSVSALNSESDIENRGGLYSQVSGSSSRVGIDNYEMTSLPRSLTSNIPIADDVDSASSTTELSPPSVFDMDAHTLESTTSLEDFVSTTNGTQTGKGYKIRM
ncbi:Aureobasidin resistance protein Aur1 [Scheffersomyces spartinae]|uniref:Aureobasidin resistance protein Aur1 n=1 Tax=Scheffersomyces spartinae TaxID=45513 RepID=A0A9P8AJW7_9ASCO|nr:Aureobasidin resistance protein Aur1 [Scheffersomyces spartinae]KAG7195855.1 Aureobasidin resistance protein Aur1 [Scheffersomyces spartinae]